MSKFGGGPSPGQNPQAGLAPIGGVLVHEPTIVLSGDFVDGFDSRFWTVRSQGGLTGVALPFDDVAAATAAVHIIPKYGLRIRVPDAPGSRTIFQSLVSQPLIPTSSAGPFFNCSFPVELLGDGVEFCFGLADADGGDGYVFCIRGTANGPAARIVLLNSALDPLLFPAGGVAIDDAVWTNKLDGTGTQPYLIDWTKGPHAIYGYGNAVAKLLGTLYIVDRIVVLHTEAHTIAQALIPLLPSFDKRFYLTAIARRLATATYTGIKAFDVHSCAYRRVDAPRVERYGRIFTAVEKVVSIGSAPVFSVRHAGTGNEEIRDQGVLPTRAQVNIGGSGTGILHVYLSTTTAHTLVGDNWNIASTTPDNLVEADVSATAIAGGWTPFWSEPVSNGSVVDVSMNEIFPTGTGLAWRHDQNIPTGMVFVLERKTGSPSATSATVVYGIP